LPYGWEKKCVRRPDGKTKGRWDYTLRPPGGNLLRRQAELLEFLKQHPEVPHDDTVTHFRRPWTSSDNPANKEIIACLPNRIKSAARKSPEQPPRSPHGRNSGRRLSKAAPRNLVTDTYVEI
jgi:hypothetical protein